MSKLFWNSLQLFLFTTLVFFNHPVIAQRTDILVLKNGDHITGEIKKLEYGLLTYKTDNAGTLTVKWKDVMRLKSAQTFELTLKNGDVHDGSLDSTANNKEIVLVLEEKNVYLDMNDLVGVVQIRSLIWSRFSGDVSLGLSYTKGSQVLKSDLGGDFIYRSLHDRISLIGNSVLTLQRIVDSNAITKKQDLILGYSRYFAKKWFLTGFTGVEQNTELGINARVLIGVGAGKDLFQNHFHNLRSIGGFVANREFAVDGGKTNNFEGAALLDYRIYKYNYPRVILSSNLYCFPSLTNPGRVRLNGQIKVDFEFFSDFYFSISNYHNYDNRPATAGASTYDFGVTTSISYKFNK